MYYLEDTHGAQARQDCAWTQDSLSEERNVQNIQKKCRWVRKIINNEIK